MLSAHPEEYDPLVNLLLQVWSMNQQQYQSLSLFEMQNLRPYFGPTKTNPTLTEIPRWFAETDKFEKHSFKAIKVRLKAKKKKSRISSLLEIQSKMHFYFCKLGTFRIIIIHTSVALYNLIKGPSHSPFACSVVPPCEVHREASVISIFQMWKLRFKALNDVPELPATTIRAQSFWHPNSRLREVSTLFLNNESLPILSSLIPRHTACH